MVLVAMQLARRGQTPGLPAPAKPPLASPSFLVYEGGVDPADPADPADLLQKSFPSCVLGKLGPLTDPECLEGLDFFNAIFGFMLDLGSCWNIISLYLNKRSKK